MKKIITFSLWGDDLIYWNGALKNIELSKNLYPDFICRLYIDQNSPSRLIESIKETGSEVIMMSAGGYNYQNLSSKFNHQGLFWRFLSLSDPDVDVVLSRDCDSRISEREVQAVRQWLESDKDFHIMRDHPYHGVPILAGMWGCRNGILNNINQLLDNWSNHSNKGRWHAEDQDFLGQMIYPIIKNNCVEHSEFGINFGNHIYKFPGVRKDFEFVGDVFDINNNRHPDYWKIIKNYG